jgi:two-component sensor histidine kinase
MQSRQLRDGSTLGALEECKARIQAIALIHEKLYQSQDYAHVPFAEYTRSLARIVVDAAGVSPARIALKLDLDEITLPVDRAIPCGLILNELIMNALKHAFPGDRTGTIHVELREDAGRVSVTVMDDGVGMPAGFDPRASSSLGMQLVGTLVEQLQGGIELAGERGTAVRVSFPAETAA